MTLAGSVETVSRFWRLALLSLLLSIDYEECNCLLAESHRLIMRRRYRVRTRRLLLKMFIRRLDGDVMSQVCGLPSACVYFSKDSFI